MELLLSYAAFGAIALLAAMSPGPDFLVVSKNSISHSRSVGVWTAIGVALGNCVHVGYTLIGIGLIISQSIIVFSMVKIAGAIYLIYLGVQLMTENEEAKVPTENSSEEITKRGAFKQGFLTNVLNPKATLFFVSVFSQFVSPKLSIGTRSLFGIEAIVIIGSWFVLLAFILTYPAIRRVIGRIQTKLLKVMGAGLLLLGVKLGLSQQ